MINHHLLMRIQPLQNLAALPVPEDDVSLAVARGEEPAVRGEANGASVAGDGVPGKAFFAVLAEVVGRVDEDLVVKGLRGEPFVCDERGVRASAARKPVERSEKKEPSAARTKSRADRGSIKRKRPSSQTIEKKSGRKRWSVSKAMTETQMFASGEKIRKVNGETKFGVDRRR